jgi:hypothetical protein
MRPRRTTTSDSSPLAPSDLSTNNHSSALFLEPSAHSKVCLVTFNQRGPAHAYVERHSCNCGRRFLHLDFWCRAGTSPRSTCQAASGSAGVPERCVTNTRRNDWKRPLSDQLSQSKGIICPPTGIDPGIAAPPVGGGRTPVIPRPPAHPAVMHQSCPNKNAHPLERRYEAAWRRDYRVIGRGSARLSREARPRCFSGELHACHHCARAFVSRHFWARLTGNHSSGLTAHEARDDND